jgi:O-antigen ligase
MACVVALPLSEYVLSMAEIFLAANFLAEGKYKEKFNSLKSDRFALLNLSLFFMLIIGLLYTSDYAYAMKDIRIKLPLLLCPIIFSTTSKMSKK